MASPIANNGTEFIEAASEGSVFCSVYIASTEESASVEFVDPISATIFITDESCILILPWKNFNLMKWSITREWH